MLALYQSAAAEFRRTRCSGVRKKRKKGRECSRGPSNHAQQHPDHPRSDPLGARALLRHGRSSRAVDGIRRGHSAAGKERRRC